MVGVSDAIFGVTILLLLVFGSGTGISLGLFSAAGVVAIIVVAASLAGPLGRAMGLCLDWEGPAAHAVGFVILLGAGPALFLCLRGLLKRSLLGQPRGSLTASPAL